MNTPKQITRRTAAVFLSFMLIFAMLPSYVSAAGTCSQNIHVMNRDGDNEDIEDIVVELYRDGLMIMSANTFSSGDADFDGLEPGEYTVKVPAGTYNGRTYEEFTEIITISEGSNSTLDIYLTFYIIPGTYTLTGTVFGIIEDDAGTLHLYRNGIKVSSKNIGDGGSFAFYNQALGEYVLRFESTGYAGNDQLVTISDYETVCEFSCSDRTGSANPKTIAGRVHTDDDGLAGVAGVTVNLCDAVSGMPWKTTTTDENGDYAFTDVIGSSIGMEYYAVVPDGNYGGQWYTGGNSSDLRVHENELLEEPINIKITPNANTYTATLTVNKDGNPWAGHGKTFTLKLSVNESVTEDMTGAGGTVTATVVNGTWKVYDGATDTGATITINGAAGGVTFNYYTVTFSVNDAGTANDSTIYAHHGSGFIDSGAVVLGGNTLTLIVYGGGALSYTYAWSGTASGTTDTYITTVGAAVNAVCTVTGTGEYVAPSITTSSLPNGKVGTAYNQILTADGTTPITWTKTAGDLPGGLTLSSGGGITGTPTDAGVFMFTVRASNRMSNVTKELSIAVDPVFTALPGPITGTQTDAEFTVNGKYVDLHALYLNGVPLTIDRTNPARLILSGWPGYNGAMGEAVSGSVIITMYQGFLAALPNGTYTLQTVFQAGGAAQPYSSPTTQFVVARPDGSLSGGGSTGGSTDSGSSRPVGSIINIPATTYNVTVTVNPDTSTAARLTFSPSPDKNNGLTFTVTEDMLRQALDKAKAEAKQQNRDQHGYTLECFFSTKKTINQIQLTFDADALALLETAGVKAMSVITNAFRFGLDADVIQSLNRQSGGKAVMVSASRFFKLSDVAKKYIGSRPVWDVTLQYKKAGKPVTISDLTDGVITMGIKYNPAEGENKEYIAAVYIPRDGKAQILDGTRYDDGWVTCTRNSLSVYGVGYVTLAPVFTDTVNHWAKEHIDYVTGRGLITGTSATAFSPEVYITRADFLMALGRLSGADMSGYTASRFADMDNAHPAMAFIEWAVQNKIVTGTDDNRFSPELPITREQMAVMMYNYAKATNYVFPVNQPAVRFTDDNKISVWAKDGVAAIQQVGIIGGRPGNIFDPQANATRAEAATILRFFVEQVINEGISRGWVQNEAGEWQYINVYGKPITGWLEDTNGSKYWFNDQCAMASGKWVQIDGIWYYFYADGRLVVTTVIDGVRKEGVN